jgi:hypothetical protein
LSVHPAGKGGRAHSSFSLLLYPFYSLLSVFFASFDVGVIKRPNVAQYGGGGERRNGQRRREAIGKRERPIRRRTKCGLTRCKLHCGFLTYCMVSLSTSAEQAVLCSSIRRPQRTKKDTADTFIYPEPTSPKFQGDIKRNRDRERERCFKKRYLSPRAASFNSLFVSA